MCERRAPNSFHTHTHTHRGFLGSDPLPARNPAALPGTPRPIAPGQWPCRRRVSGLAPEAPCLPSPRRREHESRERVGSGKRLRLASSGRRGTTPTTGCSRLSRPTRRNFELSECAVTCTSVPINLQTLAMTFQGANMFALLDDEDGPKPVAAAKAPAAKTAPTAKKPAKLPEKPGARCIFQRRT